MPYLSTAFIPSYRAAWYIFNLFVLLGVFLLPPSAPLSVSSMRTEIFVSLCYCYRPSPYRSAWHMAGTQIFVKEKCFTTLQGRFYHFLFENEETGAQGGRLSHPWSCPVAHSHAQLPAVRPVTHGPAQLPAALPSRPRSCPVAKQQSQETPGTPRVISLSPDCPRSGYDPSISQRSKRRLERDRGGRNQFRLL